MDEAKLRAWWWRRQGLDGSLEGRPPSEVLERSGWARSVGGSGPYLTLFARAGTRREAADAALANLEIHELPSARGCTYVIPKSEFALALKVGQGFGDAADMKTARKLGATADEIDKLCDAVRAALQHGPLEPEALREATGSSVRHLGPEGVKKGLSTTLPVALGLLQSSGHIRRIPNDGRLDRQRYRYSLWNPNPLAGFNMTLEEAYTQLARRFFTWIGPATPAEFQWFSGLGVKAAKAAMAPLDLVLLASGSDRLLFAGDREEFMSFQPAREPRYALVSSIDAISQHRRDTRGLVAPEDLRRSVFVERGLQALSSLTDLPSHAILDRGRLAGLWEYDVESNSIAWMSFVPKNSKLEEAVRRTEEFVTSQLGDARSFSLDSPKSRAPRIVAIRRAAVSG